MSPSTMSWDMVEMLSGGFAKGVQLLEQVKEEMENAAASNDEGVPDLDFQCLSISENLGELTFWFLGKRFYIDIALVVHDNTGVSENYTPELRLGLYEGDEKLKPTASIYRFETARTVFPRPGQIQIEAVTKTIYQAVEQDFPLLV